MKTVLVVDDEFDIVEVLISVLGDEGYRVITAADGRQGLDRLAETPADLVLLDYMMPRMDGPAMARAMRDNPAYRHIPIVLMSAVGESSARGSFTAYAAFLRKPFRIRTVLDLIARLIGPGAKSEA